jgi:hypothetical protein
MSSISMTTLYFAASTTPLGDSGVTSTSILFIPSWENLNGAPSDVVCFVGNANGLDVDVASFYGGGGNQCQSTNGCGVHVHAGTDCANNETQSTWRRRCVRFGNGAKHLVFSRVGFFNFVVVGHWYNNATLSSDPWAIIGYASTNTSGYGEFANCVRTGFDLTSDPSLLTGRTFIIHAEDGSRVSCGSIEETSSLELSVAEAELSPIPGSTPPLGDDGVTGFVSIMSNLINGVSDGVCYQGYAMSLEPDVVSFLLDSGSSQCRVENGCGAHIHSGTECANREVQGGHYYDSDELAVDPWLAQSYYDTDSDGAGAFVGCVLTGTGATDYENRPFIVHGTDGSRLSCGILSTTTDIDATDPGSSGKQMFSPSFMVTGFVAGAIGLFLAS